MMSIRWIVPIAAALVLAAAIPARAQRARPSGPPLPPIQIQKLNRTSGTLAYNRLTSHPLAINPATRDRLGVYTARPVLAVGDITSVDLTRRTIAVKIDRALSSMPHVLTAQARKKKVEKELADRMFPPERTFIIRRTTTLLDENRATTGSRAAMMSPRERFDAMRLKLEDFRLGDRISVLFRYYENEAQPPGVLNVSRVRRDRRDFEADYRMVPVLHRTMSDGPTTYTQANGQVTTTVLPSGVMVPPRVPRARPIPHQSR